jgi:hypothetical protein
MRVFRRILHATDFSSASCPALARVIVLARQNQRSVAERVLRVAPCPVLTIRGR